MLHSTNALPDFRGARSYQFVPGDSERKIARSFESEADALIYDLEDSVMPEAKAGARLSVADAIPRARAALPGIRIVVRVNALETGMTADDLLVVMPARPDAILLPKVEAAETIVTVANWITDLEDARPRTAILPIATETAAAVFRIEEIANAHPRVKGIAYGVEDLASAMGLGRSRTAAGDLLAVFQTVRHLAVLAAHTAGIAAIDTPHTMLDRLDLLEDEACEAAASGFTGKFALHPDQIATINTTLRIAPAIVAEAEEILALSRDGGGSVFRYNGRMIDTPHLQAAQALLARAASQGRHTSNPGDPT